MYSRVVVCKLRCASAVTNVHIFANRYYPTFPHAFGGSTATQTVLYMDKTDHGERHVRCGLLCLFCMGSAQCHVQPRGMGVGGPSVWQCSDNRTTLLIARMHFPQEIQSVCGKKKDESSQ